MILHEGPVPIHGNHIIRAIYPGIVNYLWDLIQKYRSRWSSRVGRLKFSGCKFAGDPDLAYLTSFLVKTVIAAFMDHEQHDQDTA